jgi:hypothetical protein
VARKRIIAVILLFVFCGILFNYLIFISYINSQKSSLRQTALFDASEQSERMEMSLNSLYKDVNGFIWTENNRELVVNGIYYEVIKVVVDGDNAFVSIVKDSKENSLLSDFFRSAKNSDNLLFHVVKLIMNMNFEASVNFEFTSFFSTLKNSFSNVILNELLTDLRFIKPPQLFLQ